MNQESLSILSILNLFEFTKLLVPAKSLQVVEGVDVVEGVSVKCFGHPGCRGGGVRIKHAGQNPHDRKLTLGADLRNKKAGEFFTESIGYL